MSSATATPVHFIFDRGGQPQGQTTKSDINALILDYLTVAGYPRAAAKFSTEANLEPQQDCESVAVRQRIQNDIHKGRVQEAIASINDLDSEILDKEDTLHFSLLRLQLVELIRECTKSGDGDIAPALRFAQAYLAPRAPTNSRFLADLEKTMALLVFPHDKLGPDLAPLLDSSLRQEVAENVNKIILERQTARRESAIRNLVHLRAWAENEHRDRGKTIPKDLEMKLSLDLNGNPAPEPADDTMDQAF